MTLPDAAPSAEREGQIFKDESLFAESQRSVSGKAWTFRQSDQRAALMIQQACGVSDVVATALVARGVHPEDAETFLSPTLKDLLPDPSRFKDMDIAAVGLADAIENGEKIGILADYDVDGATSSSILARYLRNTGQSAEIYIPDRLSEGYGPSDKAMNAFADAGVSVVVVMDCGTTAFGPLETAAKLGLSVIVVDHHEAEAKLPKAAAIINPNRLDEDRAYGHLCTAGLVFLVTVALNRELRERGYWNAERPEPVLTRTLDLVALGTVCDVVKLTDLNRAFVVQGLKVLANRANTGLRVLADVASLNETPSSYHLGFVLGPRINAGGRIGDSGLGARLLRTDDEGEAAGIATKLDILNAERKSIEADVFEQALRQAEEYAESSAVVVTAGEGWHPGVVGIVASRLVERFGRPACVIALNGGEGTGSGRSIHGVDLGAAVIAGRQAGILTKGGGHTMAAGFSLAAQQVDVFRSFLGERLGEEIDSPENVPTIRLDGRLSLRGAALPLAEEIEKLAPFGPGNPEPRFLFENVRVGFSDVVGSHHIRLSMTGAQGSGSLDGIAFRTVGTALGDLLLNSPDQNIHVVGRIKVDTWGGNRRVKLHLEDAMRS